VGEREEEVFGAKVIMTVAHGLIQSKVHNLASAVGELVQVQGLHRQPPYEL
jgi:hypothetical protein